MLTGQDWALSEAPGPDPACSPSTVCADDVKEEGVKGSLTEACRGAGVKTSMERRQAWVQEECSGMAGGGFRGDEAQGDPRDGWGDGREGCASARGGKSCRSRNVEFVTELDVKVQRCMSSLSSPVVRTDEEPVLLIGWRGANHTLRLSPEP